MAEVSGPIYEVRLFVDRDAVADCDAWLEQHVRNSLRVAGISDCYVTSLSAETADSAARVCHHILQDDEVLDDILGEFSARIEDELNSLFAEKIEIRDRVLREDDSPDIPLTESRNCLNCGTNLRGQYCGSCGQRSRSRLISLWELISDAFGDLFELDSRLWKTIVPLVFRPGQLTRDYLEGKRARFMPPFRMYLVLSLMFFVIAFFNPREDLSLFFAPPTAEELAAAEIEDEQEESVIVAFNDNEGEEIEDDCAALDDQDISGVTAWFLRGLTPERFRQVCEKIIEDKGESLLEKVINNVPTALIVLLPLMALVLKALYPLSRRYYVEHLLFFVHLHAFLFLLISAQILFARLTAAVAAPEAVTALTIVATSFYAPVYLFIAMRRVYGQGRFITFLKYIVLTFAYIAGFSTIIAITFALAAFSI